MGTVPSGHHAWAELAGRPRRQGARRAAESYLPAPSPLVDQPAMSSREHPRAELGL
jgi:hypothetical protein